MKKTGSHTETSVMAHSARGLFFLTLISTGFFVLLGNINILAQHIPVLSHVFDYGIYTNFDAQWYFTNGDVIVKTMLINAVSPLLTLVGAEIYTRLNICWDRKRCCARKDDEKKTTGT